ncbi:hypothetical protein ACWEPL_12375 [Nonomuraea sp. NPDC004186]
MTTPPFGSPEWQENFERSMRQLGETLGQVGRTFAAQGAMGWMYRGEVSQARAGLAAMSPEQLREVSAAAAALASLADEELSGRQTQ